MQIRNMFIQTQPTPNPSSLMFLPGKQVMETGSRDFTNSREAMGSPLAIKLFLVDGVSGVFFGSDFITIKARLLDFLTMRFVAVCGLCTCILPLSLSIPAKHA